jgi:hypothetical protein
MNTLGNILDYVHDRRFDLEKLNFDKANGTVSLRTTSILDDKVNFRNRWFFKIWENQIVESTLVVKHAASYSVKDEAKIGGGMINTILHAGGCVVIKCCEPVEIAITVTRFELDLLLTDVVVGAKTRFTIGLS